ncbi:MAG: (2Fe-2S)-binding protein [Planctomycetes bacterium]|nr:(2Fe-2S)-binding protein [Planctomycetota bacterium]
MDGVLRPPEITFTFAGQPISARQGETIAMALWVAGQKALRNSSKDGAPRGVLCNMGICYECLVRIEGAPVRACMVLATEGLNVEPGGKS